MYLRRLWPTLAILVLFVFMAGVVSAATLGPISEETPPAICDPGSFLNAIECSGDYCDNIQISCRPLVGAELGTAYWLPWFSEEEGTQRCPSGHLIAGLACDDPGR